METDTDSLYLALSKRCLTECIPSQQTDEYIYEVGQWMPIPACQSHLTRYKDFLKNTIEWNPGQCCMKAIKRKSRTPGKWKLEASGDEMICLNCKTYILHSSNNNQHKISTIEVNKTQNSFSVNQFKTVS